MESLFCAENAGAIDTPKCLSRLFPLDLQACSVPTMMQWEFSKPTRSQISRTDLDGKAGGRRIVRDDMKVYKLGHSLIVETQHKKCPRICRLQIKRSGVEIEAHRHGVGIVKNTVIGRVPVPGTSSLTVKRTSQGRPKKGGAFGQSIQFRFPSRWPSHTGNSACAAKEVRKSKVASVSFRRIIEIRDHVVPVSIVRDIPSQTCSENTNRSVLQTQTPALR